eukprot:CAMPEP_0119552010 /NCGR_PEP_ID=MMETSP1352-20130426/5126_1 /TAXON_ID=265584 /ORGANISM="Stauroneis constricta, Strain CCMP1120" /LENGTH=118 /DNA_ID=CAMNT_0007598171 /DNA_START=29 /DNA_END=385 /DNA_ORIENTATION=+
MVGHQDPKEQKREATKAGVPGFPDFPAEWCGQAGGDATSHHVAKQTRQRWRVKREAVNRQHHSANTIHRIKISAKAQKQKARAIRRLKLIENRKRTLRKLQLKRDMKQMNRSMAEMKW